MSSARVAGRADASAPSPVTLTYGVNLLHFGRHATLPAILDAARQAERAGFDSLFVRDHVAYRPRTLEANEPDFLDAFMTLSAAAAVTARIALGTAVLNPHRHPIHAAQLLGGLARLAGEGRVLPMWGIGGDRELSAVGLGEDRGELLREHIEIIRRLLSGERVDHSGKRYSFTDVSVHPVPQKPIPMWYGGGTVAGVRRAVETFDGWSAGHIPGRDYRRLRRKMLTLCEEAGREPLPSCISTLVSPGRTVEEGASKAGLPRVAEDIARSPKKFLVPESGRFETIADLDGAVVVGTAADVIEGVRAHQRNGVELVIFDLRQRAADWDECMQMLGEEVLPVLHREDGRKPA